MNTPPANGSDSIFRPHFYFPEENPHFSSGKSTDNSEPFGYLYPFPRVPLIFPFPNTSPDMFPGMEKLLNIPNATVEKTEINAKEEVIITVRSTAEGTRCSRCGAEISKPFGRGREIMLRHLSVFGRKTFIRICPPRYQCIRCEGSPATAQKAPRYEQRSPHTAAYEKHILLQMFNSTAEDVSIKENIGYEAASGIMNRRIAAEADWDGISEIGIIGIDEISLKKGHKDFVTAATSLAEGETAIPAVLGDRKKKTVKKFLKTIPKRLRKTVRGVCSDMYDGFIRAAEEVSGKRTGIIIGRFHVARLYRNDLDRFRRKEMRRLKKELPEEEYRNLKGAVWALRKNGRKPSEEDRQVLKCLFGYSPESETAYSFCAQLTDIFEDDISKSEAGRKIRIRKIQVRPSGLKCFDKFLKTLEKRFEGITNYFISRQTSGFAEGLNNKIKAIKRRCCGITSIGQLFRRIFPDLRGYSLFA